MIDNIIYSFDRSCQLHLLLESIEKNAENMFNINVLYKYSNEDFKHGYEILKKNFLKFKFIEEIEFKKQTLEIINNFSNKYMCFFTDDDIIYNKIKEEDIDKCLYENEEIFCFSVRLGKNISTCYTLNSDNVLILLKEDEKFIWWDWTKHYADFGYPLSVDGHIFRTKEIKKLIKAINFHNPNTLEGNLQIFDSFPKEIMVAYKASCLVNSPNNIVNKTHPNRKGETFSFNTKELNDFYLNGKIIDYNLINFSNIKGCHQELEFKFKKI